MSKIIYHYRYVNAEMSLPEEPIINPKLCLYGCNTKIYWSASNKEYSEVITKQKHICPNRTIYRNKIAGTIPIYNNVPTYNPYNKNNQKNNYESKNNYYNKKPWLNSNVKVPMDNSVEILQGAADIITNQYEVLTDLIKEFKGKTHGSQSHCLQNNILQIVVYYEVPEGMRDKLKDMFKTFIKNEMRIHQ